MTFLSHLLVNNWSKVKKKKSVTIGSDWKEASEQSMIDIAEKGKEGENKTSAISNMIIMYMQLANELNLEIILLNACNSLKTAVLLACIDLSLDVKMVLFF